MKNTFNVLDLFAGIGGFSLGLERTGHFKTVAFCEIDEAAQKVLRKHWPDTPIFGDIRDLTKEAIDSEVNIICGGFPCQDISNSGNKQGIIGERSGLWAEFYRLIDEIRPQYVIIENVSALRSKGLALVLQNLSAIRYDAEWHCIPASALGAAHQRDRVWILAYPERIGPQGQGGYINALYPTPEAFREADWLVDAFQRNALPYVCRRHDGVSRQLDSYRLKQLGNAVIPQIPEAIGRAILRIENEEGTCSSNGAAVAGGM